MRYLFATLILLLSACSTVREQDRTDIAIETNSTVSDDKTAQINKFYSDWQGTPYKLGGMSKRGVDCSAFTHIAYKQLFATYLPRTTELQAQQGHIVKQSELQQGDLVFFKIDKNTNHVGVYLTQGKFMHASSSKGVMISSLSNSYWRGKYWRSVSILKR
ncbi:C40 family peptidase [Thalassotalea agarivorans]|uniref:Lipoprotein Spr n=1 Tax=Thalassotalea agarivorans TaxID=349064 RepID=A0A1H9YAU8_THASX|nr:NlpC/P60 family protein [Thalassotalea agarivorans]SES66076.1 lipoprotein Spr [Thalassotalea agarivorans]